MNPILSSSTMAPVMNNYQHRSTNLRSKILKNEEQRVQLEQKLRSMLNKSLPTHQKRQVQHIQTYFTRLNQESQRAEQRNLQLLQDLTQAQEHLDKLHNDAQNLIRLKNDYVTYLESNYPNWRKPTSTQTSSNIDSTSNEYDRLAQNIKQQHHHQLENDGNLRQSVPIVRQSYDVDSSMLFKRYEDQLKVGLDRTVSPSTPLPPNNELKDEQSMTESNEIGNQFSYGKRNGSLRMELTLNGLYCLLDFIEKELKDTIDKKKFYLTDPPTITQKRTIIDLANHQQMSLLKDHDSTTISMVILDQLPSTIRRTTISKCLLTEDILALNIKDLDKDIIAKMLLGQDKFLWLKLVDHFVQLLKFHVMNSQILVNKFTIGLLPNNVSYLHEKAKSLLKHVVEKQLRKQSSDDEDDTSTSKQQPMENILQTNSKSSSWLKKLTSGSILDDEDEDEKSTSVSSIIKQANKSPTKTKVNKDDSDQDFFA